VEKVGKDSNDVILSLSLTSWVDVGDAYNEEVK
jgi:hypothetical protein